MTRAVKGTSFLGPGHLGTFWKLESRQSPFQGFQEVFIPLRTPCCWNTRKTRNNVVDMSQAFHDIARFECFTDLNLFMCGHCHYSSLGNGCFTIFFDGAYFLLAVIVEGDESSWLRMANWPAVLAGYRPLLTALIWHRFSFSVFTANKFKTQFLSVP